MKENIYIPLPKNISLSVFEALKLHQSFFEDLNYKTIYFSRSKKIKDQNIINCNNIFQTIMILRKQESGKIYCITIKEVLIAAVSNIFTSKKEIIFWVQGLIDDEDFLSKKNKLRHIAFNTIFKICLKISSKLVVVTNHMFEVLKASYDCPEHRTYIVIPCKSRVKYNNDKKIINSLCYIGGLSKWQNVDKILAFFNELSKRNNNYKLFIATFDHKTASILIDKFVEIKYKNNITLVSVSSAIEVESFLSKMEFGFLIRDNIPLNNVASPIKLAEYLSCGVTPVMSKSLTEFYIKLKSRDFGVFLDNDYDLGIEKLLNTKPSAEVAKECYNYIYEPNNFEQQLKFFLNT